jgi:homoserine O-acetyltransferase
MSASRTPILSACILAVLLWAVPAKRPTIRPPRKARGVVRDFRFHTGEVLPELRLHYTTVGAPTGEPC